MKLTDILKRVIKEELDLGTDKIYLTDDNLDDFLSNYTGLFIHAKHSTETDEEGMRYRGDANKLNITPLKQSAYKAAFSKWLKYMREGGSFMETDNKNLYRVINKQNDTFYFVSQNYKDYLKILGELYYSDNKISSYDTEDVIHILSNSNNKYKKVDLKLPDPESDPDEHPRYNRHVREDINPYEDPFNPFEEVKIANEVVDQIVEKLKSAFSKYRETSDSRSDYMDSDFLGVGDLNYIITEIAKYYITLPQVKDSYEEGDEIYVDVDRKDEGVYKIMIGDLLEIFYTTTVENLEDTEHRAKKRLYREDIFLKKDPENKQIVVFSDKEDKRAAAKETISLAKEFRKLGLDWKPALGHWVGGYDKLAQVNGLIKSHNRIKEVIEDLEALEDFVASTDADPTAKSQIMDNLDKYIDDLANATDQAGMDAAIKNYLTFYSKFHNYSFINSMLIFMQKKDATRVAGYKTWQKKHRGVKKGAKAIWIWFPMKINASQETDTEGVDFSGVDDAAKTRSFTKFGLGKVYDISDTYALNEKGEVPEKPNWAASNDPSEVADQLVERIKEFANDLGIKITKEKAQGGEKGFSAGGHINLSSDVQGVGAASVLVHELAHELLHWKEKSPFHVGEATRDMQELQAESVSYVVMKHYNLPVTQHPTYLVLWKANKDKIKANLQTIQKCAKYIIDGIDAQETSSSDQGGGNKEEK